MIWSGDRHTAAKQRRAVPRVKPPGPRRAHALALAASRWKSRGRRSVTMNAHFYSRHNKGRILTKESRPVTHPTMGSGPGELLQHRSKLVHVWIKQSSPLRESHFLAFADKAWSFVFRNADHTHCTHHTHLGWLSFSNTQGSVTWDGWFSTDSTPIVFTMCTSHNF